jgi:hypothetical protein
LGSVVLRVDRQALDAARELAGEAFEPGNVVSGVAEGTIEFIPAPAAAHPRRQELEAQMKELALLIRREEVQVR